MVLVQLHVAVPNTPPSLPEGAHAMCVSRPETLQQNRLVVLSGTVCVLEVFQGVILADGLQHYDALQQ
jgi:hypothetical protein